jgi:hypothetical protein
MKAKKEKSLNTFLFLVAAGIVLSWFLIWPNQTSIVHATKKKESAQVADIKTAASPASDSLAQDDGTVPEWIHNNQMQLRKNARIHDSLNPHSSSKAVATTKRGKKPNKDLAVVVWDDSAK